MAYTTSNKNLIKGDEFLGSIQNYILSPKNMMNIANNLKKNFYKPTLVEKKKANVSNLMRQKMFIPGKKDTLFWIFYILKNGFDDYNLIGSNEYVYEKEIKVKYIDKIRENKKQLHQRNLKKLSTCENELINEDIITLKTFQVLCVLDKIPYCFINSHIIYSDEFTELDGKETLSSDEEKYKNVNVIHKTNSNHYALEIDGYTMISNYIKNKYKIENLEKPIKSIGSYKVDDLKQIMKYFRLPVVDENGKSLTKPKLYDIIFKKLCI
jgi:hypothetical protein